MSWDIVESLDRLKFAVGGSWSSVAELRDESLGKLRLQRPLILIDGV
jgi:hypothetical protein